MTNEQRPGGGESAEENGDTAGAGAPDSGATEERGGAGEGPGAGRGRDGRQSFGDGIRQGIGVLGAFKDALEETIQEARERGDLSSEKAREVMKDALERAQTAAEGAKERLDFATQAEVRELTARIYSVEALQGRVAALEAAAGIVAPQSPAGAGDSDNSSDGESPAPEA